MTRSTPGPRRFCRSAAILALLGLAAQSAPEEPFGLPTVAAPVQDRWRTIWTRLEHDIEADRSAVAKCRAQLDACDTPGIRQFVALVNHGTPYQGFDRIRHINRAINLTLRTREHPVWTSPLTALSAGEGDCKQHAVIKYAAMLDAGLGADDVRLIVGSIPPGAGHAVVVVRSAGQWFVLDNRSLDVVRSDTFADFMPHYAFGRGGVRRFVPPLTSELSGLPCSG